MPSQPGVHAAHWACAEGDAINPRHPLKMLCYRATEAAAECATHWAVAEEDAIRVECQHLVCRVVCGHHRDGAAKAGQAAQDVGLYPKVVRHDVERLLAGRQLDGGVELPLANRALALRGALG